MTALIETIAGLREALQAPRRRGETIGLVPTMGALHAGHRALIDRARAECGQVVVSLFVNPTQFNQPGDLAAYPRSLEADRRICADAEVDWLFAPSREEMYPRPASAYVEVPALAEGLCGAFRPGHFRGVGTVVAKLFLIAQPDKAYFGEKDYQQLAVIRRMARDLDFPVEIVGVETVREPDGLALSSRNRLLTSEHRRVAAAIHRGLLASQTAHAAGVTQAALLRAAALDRIAAESLLDVEYVEVVDAETLAPLKIVDRPARIAAAVRAGEVRLIDNLPLG